MNEQQEHEQKAKMKNVPLTGPSSPPTSTEGHTESDNPTTDTSARTSSPVVQSSALVPVSNSDHRTWRSTDCRSGRYVNTTKTESTSPPTCFDAECTSPLCVYFVFPLRWCTALVQCRVTVRCKCVKKMRKMTRTFFSQAPMTNEDSVRVLQDFKGKN